MGTPAQRGKAPGLCPSLDPSCMWLQPPERGNACLEADQKKRKPTARLGEAAVPTTQAGEPGLLVLGKAA